MQGAVLAPTRGWPSAQGIIFSDADMLKLLASVDPQIMRRVELLVCRWPPNLTPGGLGASWGSGAFLENSFFAVLRSSCLLFLVCLVLFMFSN